VAPVFDCHLGVTLARQNPEEKRENTQSNTQVANKIYVEVRFPVRIIA
jgi:hypothetical protein